MLVASVRVLWRRRDMLYAIFLYEQLRRFPVRIWPQVLCRIHILCGKALETLNTRRHCPITSRLREIDRFAADLLDYDAL